MANSSKILQSAEDLVVQAHYYLKVRENQNRRGGYLTVLNWKRKEFVLCAKVGQVSKTKAWEHETMAREKAWRLVSHTGHETSFESRDPVAEVRVYDESRMHYPVRTEQWGHWGGAVRGNRYVFSFSGFPELLDEAMMFVLAIKHNDLSLPLVQERFGTVNRCLTPFLDHCGLST